MEWAASFNNQQQRYALLRPPLDNDDTWRPTATATSKGTAIGVSRDLDNLQNACTQHEAFRAFP
jgi:hypothetical protein